MASAGRRERDEKSDGAAKDPFVVLGVPPTASRREITDAYRKLARVHHPDQYAESSIRRRRQAERRMRELNEAYRLARTRPPATAYRGTNTVPNAALWLGTAPGTWARVARRSGSGAPSTEEERRLSQARIAEAASEHEARTRVLRDIRLQAAEGASTGRARPQAKSRATGHGGQATRALAGLGQALATSKLRCRSCGSTQALPAGWQQHLDDTDYYCSGCNKVLLAR